MAFSVLIYETCAGFALYDSGRRANPKISRLTAYAVSFALVFASLHPLPPMAETAELILDGKSITLPVIEGTEHEKAFDIGKLRDQTGYVTLDSGYKNTGATKSAITFLDGEEGILRYRGYPIEQLAEKSSFLEVAYLLIYGAPAHRG